MPAVSTPSIRAVVIDDSAYNRVTLTRMVQSDPRIQVVATAVNGEDGIKQVLRHKPDVITLDLEMPVMDGFAFLRWLMVNLPTAVIAVSSRASDRSVFKALELGALDFIAKPGGRVSPRLEEIQRDLVAKILQVAEVRLENLRRRASVADDRGPVAAAPGETCPSGLELVVIGSSTGGPPALQHLFENLPRMPVPFVVAQHMPPTFTRLFAERVNKLTPFEVREGQDGDTLEPGCVYIAPGGMISEVRRGADRLQLRVLPAGPSDLYAPSVDRLFRTAGAACEQRMAAVILTGMGDDGAEAMLEVHQLGCRTIAESADTAIIFGMPAEAIRTGAVDEILPLPAIPDAIRRLCGG
jgi:two-component system chemotaxis response regulator CheB